MNPPPTRRCPVCQKRMKPHPNERARDYAKRATCSRACGSTLMHAKRAGKTIREWRALNAPKTCTVCGTEFTRRPTEEMTRYAARLVCSVKCVAGLQSSREYRERLTREASERRRTPKAATFRERLDARPADTPLARWKPPQATRTPAPDPVPTAKPRTRSRPTQSLTRTFVSTIRMHPELLTALTDPAYGLHIGGPDNSTGYGPGTGKQKGRRA